MDLDMENIQSKMNMLRCPDCKSSTIMLESSECLKCENCNEKYYILNENSADLLANKNMSTTKLEIQRFWGDTCKQWYDAFDEKLDRNKLEKHLQYMEEMFSYRKHLAVTEMELKTLQGLNVLEIGSGGGAHSALFQKYGANVISIDITLERVLSTSKKLSLLSGSKGVAFLSDAENLPFNDESFDIVYSNGVLHHSENTEKCVEEVYRVLKPNAKAILMLYSRHSAHYWLNLFVKGVITRVIFQYPEYKWLGRITEGKPVYGETRNPVTRVYSRRQLVNLFKKYKIISLRKYNFDFSQLPIIGKYKIRTSLLKLLGHKPHPGGIIVYGVPRLCGSRIELFLSQFIGYSWAIVVKK
jgi:ubiquinone/menaquinone biosynthesis C-methylase UbiE